jgi:hypothetical protein
MLRSMANLDSLLSFPCLELTVSGAIGGIWRMEHKRMRLSLIPGMDDHYGERYQGSLWFRDLLILTRPPRTRDGQQRHGKGNDHYSKLKTLFLIPESGRECSGMRAREVCDFSNDLWLWEAGCENSEANRDFETFLVPGFCSIQRTAVCVSRLWWPFNLNDGLRTNYDHRLDIYTKIPWDLDSKCSGHGSSTRMAVRSMKCHQRGNRMTDMTFVADSEDRHRGPRWRTISEAWIERRINAQVLQHSNHCKTWILF